ncbi:MAG: hypothetical protein OXL41_00505 [Nitrospinae bacterium]|nr:hypothetical protein [Nitrospinota bacterium]
MSFSKVVEIAEGKVYVLHNTFALDGRISAYPISARGHSVSNCYLLKEDAGALLLDTGYAAHEAEILAQLESILDPATPLHLLPLRINEFMSVGNAMAVAKHFNVVECLAPVPEINEWLEFEALEPGGGNNDNPILPTTILKPLHPIRIGGRYIEVMNAPIRLISTRWIYDAETRTLFTSDMFSHLWANVAEGPWMLDEDGVTTTSFVRSFLLNTRYWWLEGARTDSIRKGIADVFERYDIETIAPGYGAILRGRHLVERQFSVLDEVLADLDQSVVKPGYVALGLER